MPYTITIETIDGATGASDNDAINLSPGAKVRRSISFADGVYEYPRPTVDPDPTMKDTLSCKDTLEIQSTFAKRPTDVDALITMLKDRTAGDSFKVTIQRKTGSNEEIYCVPNQLNIQYEEGEGETREITLSMKVVNSYTDVS